MELSEIAASVNIEPPCPHGYGNIGPGHVLDNGRQISYIQPLIDSGEVLANNAYWVNRKCHDENIPPVVRPGRNYMFWFRDLATAERFCMEFNGELEESPALPA